MIELVIGGILLVVILGIGIGCLEQAIADYERRTERHR